MSTTAVYPPKAAPAIGYLKASTNDIDIFVEDKANPNMWVRLLKNFLPEGIRLTNVTPLGGRTNVIAACRADQKDAGRRRLYIIDADLDLIRGMPKPRLKHLYRLNSYCVENYMLHERGFVDIITMFNQSVDEATAARVLNFNEIMANAKAFLEPLFVYYAVANSLVTSTQTVGYSVHKLLDDNTKLICPRKAKMRIYSLLRSLREHVDESTLRNCYNEYSQAALTLNMGEFVSAKDYILPIFWDRIRRTCPRIDVNACKVLLASSIDPSIDPYLRKRLRQVCKVV